MASDGGGLKPESTWKPRNEIFFFSLIFGFFLKVHPFWILDYAPNYLVGGLDTVQKTFFLVHTATYSLKHADQHLLLQFCSKIAVNFLQALFRKISKKMKKIFSIKWVRPRGESNPGLWVDRQVSNPLYYEGFTKWVVKNKNIFQMSKISKLL